MKSNLVKVVVIALLALALFIPVSMIQNLVGERQARRNEAVTGIAEGWGARQTIAGPYLVIPYERSWTEITREEVPGKKKDTTEIREKRTERTEQRLQRLNMRDVGWNVDASISEKARGIYKARLYVATAKLQGQILVPARFGIEESDPKIRIKLGTPELILGISDPHGIRSVGKLVVDGRSYTFGPGAGHGTPKGIHAALPDLYSAKPQTLGWSFSLELAGAEAFSLQPLGADTTVEMRADWPHPSFQGQFLPLSHEVSAQGFSARWHVSQYAALDSESLGVLLYEPAGLYQQLERASKYGFLFIGLTFAAFLLFELLRRLAIHPVQYALVGLALAIFFLLLTALSEHIDFAAAYAIATFACVGLITGYLARVLRSARIGLAFGGALAALYAMLFALLKAEDYSLLGGSLLLFGLLAAVMIATRRVDWYGLGAKAPA